MYAIVEVGNRQLKVAKDDQILIERSVSARTHKLTLDKVLLIAKDKAIKLGQPYLKDSQVDCEIIGRLKGKKKIAFTYRRRKGSQRKKGQRQHLLKLKVKEIKGA